MNPQLFELAHFGSKTRMEGRVWVSSNPDMQWEEHEGQEVRVEGIAG